MLAKILSFIFSIPKIIDGIKSLWGMLAGFIKRYKDNQRKKKLKEATTHAKKTKDTSKIEDHFNPSRPDDNGSK